MPLHNVYQQLLLLLKVTTGFQIVVSDKRYCDMYKAINDNSTPLKIPVQFHTIWLSIQIAVESLNELLELKLHFQVTRQSEKYYTSDFFAQYIMMKSIWHIFFFESYYEYMNKLLESKNIDKMQLLPELVLLFETIGKRLLLPISKINLFACHIEDFFTLCCIFAINSKQRLKI